MFTEQTAGWIDAALLCVVAFSTYLSYRRGFLREAVLASLFLGIAFLAVAVLSEARYWKADITAWNAQQTAVILGGLAIAAILIVAAIYGMDKSLTRLSRFGPWRVVDRGLGALFGFARGAAVAIAVYLVAGTLWFGGEEWETLSSSRSMMLVERMGGDPLVALIPKDPIRERIIALQLPSR
ncbi:MAG: CvpA family protein [Inquilinaceae bacterium]